MGVVLLFAFVLSPLSFGAPASGSAKPDRPNIVWLVTEDNSKHYLRLYEEGGAPMPSVERLAEQGLVFDYAFSNAPVCSVARSTIISGCYAPRLGAQFHRGAALVPLPNGLRMFPYYLRQAGYFTTNNSKTDYNVNDTGSPARIPADPSAGYIGDVWNESSGKASFRDRDPGQPFFHVQNFSATHEYRMHFSETEVEENTLITDPGSFELFPQHPETPLFRYSAAYYRDLHREVDVQIGAVIDQLEQDGLMDDTFIFYYGDHGGVLPGSKGYLTEQGLHVPLVVYVPERWQHLVPAQRGSRVQGFVSFVDLAPTVLALADVPIPDEIDGSAFLGAGVPLAELERRDTAFGYADRFDEKCDFVRSLRKGRYKYVRNYQPFNFDALYNEYRYKMLAYQQWRELFEAGELGVTQRQFFTPKPAEALYDLKLDPHETENLAAAPAHSEVLRRLRSELADKVKALPDLSFIPEPVLLAESDGDPASWGRGRREAIARLVDVADLALAWTAVTEDRLQAALEADDPWLRYWGLIAASAHGRKASALVEQARLIAASDPENLVRTRAAEFLGLLHEEDPAPVLIECLKAARDEVEATLILNSIVLLRDGAGYAIKIDPAQLDPAWTEDKRSNVARRLEYLARPREESETP